MTKEEIIKKYNMLPHPEGGYFAETFKSDVIFNKDQTLYSSILFLLGKNDISHLHVLEEDELWYYQGGDDCTVIEINKEYEIKEIKLGINSKDSVPQYLVKKGMIFGSKCGGEHFTLVGCMVAPSFTYDHFKLLKRNDLEGKMGEKDLDKYNDFFIR